MKKIILILVYICINVATAQVMPSNERNIMVLKYSTLLNGLYSSHPILICKDNCKQTETQILYNFSSTDNSQKDIFAEFYTIDKDNYIYRELALFDGVAIDINQLRDILSPMSAGQRDEYLNSFQYIFLIDLDAPNRLNPNEFKTLLVKPYFPWEHGRSYD